MLWVLIASTLFVSPEMRELTLDVGDHVRLAPEALKLGWRVDNADTRSGVLWPVEGETGTFFARCPGNTRIFLSPFAPRLVFVDARAPQITVRPGPAPETCKLGFDPPRQRNPGRLVYEMFRRESVAIVLRIGEEFTLEAPPEYCSQAWEELRSSDDSILQRVELTRYRAMKRGATILTTAWCRPNFEPSFPGRLLVVVE